MTEQKDGTIPVAYDIDALPDPEFDPDLIAQAAEESFPEEEAEPSVNKEYNEDEARDPSGRWTAALEAERDALESRFLPGLPGANYVSCQGAHRDRSGNRSTVRATHVAVDRYGHVSRLCGKHAGQRRKDGDVVKTLPIRYP